MPNTAPTVGEPRQAAATVDRACSSFHSRSRYRPDLRKMRRRRSAPYPTGLIQAVETASRTPFRELSCEQVRELLGQRFGLERLAESIRRFVARYPSATIMNYPGEMSLLTLQAATEFLAFAPQAFRDWLRSDFDWMNGAYGWSRQLRREADEALSTARLLAGIP